MSGVIGQFPCGGKPEEEKTVTASTTAVTVTPTSGKTIKKVTVNPTPTETKEITPSESAQTITPTSGKHLSQVTVNAISGVHGVTIDGEKSTGDSLDLTSVVDAWRRAADLPVVGSYGCAVVFNGEPHYLGGSVASSTGSYAHYKFDGENWVQASLLGNSPTLYQLKQGGAVVYNGEIHVLGSSNESYVKKHIKWDGTTWTSMPALPTKFYAGSAVVLNNEIHIIGGDYEAKSHYKWDGTTWTKLANLPYDFNIGSAVVYRGEIHILGGRTSKTSHYRISDTGCESVSTLPYEFNLGCAVVLNDEIHIMGSNIDEYAFEHYRWDGATWEKVSDLQYDITTGSAVVINDAIHVIGGYDTTHKRYCIHEKLYRKV